MLRPAMQCVRGAVKAVSCSRVAVAQPFTPRALFRSGQFVPVLSVSAMRCYSAEAGGMQKSEVVGRIMELLKGFDKIKDPAKVAITTILASHLSLSSMQLTENSHFSNDLGLDSLDTVEVVMAIEEEFSIEIPDKQADAIHSVDQAVEYILHQPDAH